MKPDRSLEPPANWPKDCIYYIYHDEGHYDYYNGSYRQVCGIPHTERYDRIGNNRGLDTLQESINHMNRCRANSSPPRPPVKIKRVVQWKIGSVVEIGNVEFWKTLYEN